MLGVGLGIGLGHGMGAGIVVCVGINMCGRVGLGSCLRA